MALSLSKPIVATWTLSGQFSNSDSARTVTIEHSPFTVGRNGDQSLSIPSPTVSGRHAELLLKDNTLWVRDLGSTNGTFVNGARLQDTTQVNSGDLLQFAQVVFRVGLNSSSRPSQTVCNDSSDRALALIQFDKLMTERAIAPHFQPIVTMDGQPFGYEVLGRSRLFGLRDPGAMFMAASVLNLESELSRIMRIEGIRAGAATPGQMLLFVNTHPSEMDEPEVLELSLREARELAPTRPLVLEIHEATATRAEPMRRLRAMLNDLNIGLAYDDFGAGQARLVELVDVPPDYLKFDMKLVQDICNAPLERQKMIGQLVKMTRDLGIVPLAEGIETQEDHEVCCQLGFACAQGYLYGKPAPPEQLRQQ